MNFRWLATGLMLLVSGLTWAQVSIKDPQHLDVPEQRVQVLHNVICRVVAREFRARTAETCGPVTVFLGQTKEGIAADELNGVFTIYLERWDEPAFAMADMRLAVQRLGLSQDRWKRMARVIINRVNQISPVSAKALQKKNGSLLARPDSGRNCLREGTGSEGKNPCVPDSVF